MKIEKLIGKEINKPIKLFGKDFAMTTHIEAPNNFELQNKINELVDAVNFLDVETKIHVQALDNHAARLHKLESKLEEKEEAPTIEVRTGTMKMCEKCMVVPATLCSSCVPDIKKEKEPEIKNCPFCGSFPDIYVMPVTQDWHIRCNNRRFCDFVVSSIKEYKTKKDAVEAWNRRRG
jgi:hypothetical protein